MKPFTEILGDMKGLQNVSTFDELIAFSEREITPLEISQLATVLAESGTILKFGESEKMLADIPSTGGPSSLSTLITPLLLKRLGCRVPKLGVPGRPAGGIDVLAQIEGYDIRPDNKTIEQWLDKGDYVHFVGGEQYAPLDEQLFKHRKYKGKVGVASLVIASILSKKIAVGLQHTGLDIRVSDFGNFGNDWNTAKSNAKLFIEVADLVNIKATCFLTNSNVPLQPYIGRGESLLALRQVFEGGSENHDWLMNHVTECYAMSHAVACNTESPADFETLETDFIENIEIQRGSVDHFYKLTEIIKMEHSHGLYSETEGFVAIDLLKIRSAIVEIQSKSQNGQPFPDPCGIILSVRHGAYVRGNTILCTYRCDKQFEGEFKHFLKQAIRTDQMKQVGYNFEIIR